MKSESVSIVVHSCDCQSSGYELAELKNLHKYTIASTSRNSRESSEKENQPENLYTLIVLIVFYSIVYFLILILFFMSFVID